MNPAHDNHRPLPHYGIRDDEKTRPYVVLFDWNGDEDAAVHVRPIEQSAAASPPPLPRVYMDDIDDLAELDADDLKVFRPRWHGIGPRPGAVALAVVLALSFTIGAFALLGAGEGQVEAAATSTLSNY